MWSVLAKYPLISRHYSRAGKFSLDYYTVLVFISHSSSRLSPQLATTVAATLAMLGTLLLLVLVRYLQLPTITIMIMIHCTLMRGSWPARPCCWCPPV